MLALDLRQLNLTRGGGGPWTPEQDSAVMAYFDGRDLANGAVAIWNSRGSRGGSALQSTAANQPIAASGVVTGDGSNDRLTQTVYPMYSDQATFLSAVTLPNGASNATAGKGWTNTGLTLMGDGTYWCGNHGKALPGDPTYASSLVHVSADFSTILGEIILAPIYAGIESVQGVARDTTDNTLWFADLIHKKLQHITTAGVDVGDGFVATGGLTPNGVAYNPTNDSIFVNYSDSNNINEYSCATGAVLKTYSYLQQGGADHLFYDSTNNLLWFAYGAANSPGIVTVINLTNSAVVKSYLLPEADAIEGGFLVNSASGQMILCNDGYFHNGVPALNRILTYTLPYPTAPFGKTDVIDMFWCGKFLVAPAATKGVLQLGQPTITTPVEQCFGSGIYFTTATNMRVIIQTMTAGVVHQVVANFTVPDITTQYRMCYARGDTTANLISAWCDGTSVGTASATTLDDGLLGLGQSIQHVAVASFIGNVAELAHGYTFGAADRPKIEGYVMWANGLQANLPGSHLHAAAPPRPPL